jgi:hypothetical protein
MKSESYHKYEQSQKFIPQLNDNFESNYQSISSQDRGQWGDTMDVQFDTYRKKVTIISLFCILLNLFLFAYVGPFPWSHAETIEEEETNNYFYGWDAAVIFLTCFLLIWGFVRRTTAKADAIKGFMFRISIMMVLQIINCVFLITSVGWTELATENVIVRALCIVAEVILCMASWEAYKFLKLHSPIFV